MTQPIGDETAESAGSSEEETSSLYDVLKPPSGADPFDMVKGQLSVLGDDIRELVDTDHPVLKLAASHFFSLKSGKKFRPTIVLHMAKICAAAFETAGAGDEAGAGGKTEEEQAAIFERQRKLGQITEMIHTASLIHDDVLDEAETRRGFDAVHKVYSNKVAVLAGDFLLARASVLLARLGNVVVVEEMAKALDALVTGEVMQARARPEDLSTFDWYIRKSYYKTASLIAQSCKSAALLQGFLPGSEQVVAAEKFGYHLGLSFQIVDDLLDFTASADLLGKPALSDVRNGHATAPVLFAMDEHPALKPLIHRKFKNDGDVDLTFKLLKQSKGLQRTKELAEWHAQEAARWLSVFPETESSQALVRVLNRVVTRQK
uniref:Solanesyl diphosphate synthase n=1 Tax=Chromera velia CCMP2878 TaxID=1169474 RepID=A0A0G4IEF1_9ALVE|eukprot:Cvel_13572.t1-p1 / transcript=Cvel_13572.t1 / gene=Cvel_13572 / organism=Chromera_velia_CCMP2878 / gene_product=Solanesyl-diphosphate synthase 1, mitochondrial, putative / transcript_product=Solanesyl-diphosphate synthase 1, mitochondrial, putative / location=Cvel_scaffold932:50032-53116(+) / protein_length=374 / sequence_SO=supercontig / SO=protein_coding / is_pseudo=false